MFEQRSIKARRIHLAAAALAMLGMAAPAAADGYGLALTGQQAVDFGFTTMNSVIGNNALDAMNQPRQGAGARGPAPAGRLAPTAPGGGAMVAGAASLPCQPSSPLARAALDAYLARLKSNDPKLAPIAADQFGRHDYRQVYRGLTRGTGRSEHDLVDIMAAWTMLGWMVANNHLDIPDGGQLPRHADAVAQLFRRTGADLRQLAMTGQGPVQRQRGPSPPGGG